ncbi:MAG: DUF4856 domain-containing protein [Flavobacteriaceae bacterium]|nr:DUF4856 domain-containing protein [Flavobacteriaceae bacterium]
MNNYSTIFKYLFIIAFPLFIISCGSDDDGNLPIEITVPANYEFLRDGMSTVSFSGQTTRLNQVDEIYLALNSNTYNETQLDEMFADGAGFTDSALNGTGKNVRGKTSAGCAAGSSATQAQFDAQIADFANNVVPAWSNDASAGIAGKLTDASRSIHVNAKGHEIDQTFVKGLIGGMTLDQIVNNYLQPCQLESGSRKDDNTNGVLSSGKNYTDMEHKWDEAFGYLYGQEEDAKRADLGSTPNGKGTTLNKYFKKINDSNQPGIAEIVFNAFKKGRAAIVAGDYQVRDAQANIIQIHLSKVIGYKAVDYLNGYMSKMAAGNTADAFHALSEGYGFVMSLQFTNNGSNVPYFTKAEADAMLAKMDDFWTVQDSDLTIMVSDIKSKFGI